MEWKLEVVVVGLVVEVVARIADIALVASAFGPISWVTNFVVVTT